MVPIASQWNRLSQAWRAAIVAGLLVLAVGLVFGQTVGHEFLEWDDGEFVSQNPHIAGGLSLKEIIWALTDGPFHEWHPLATWSDMLDCQLFGLWAGGHHLTAVILHATAAVLLLVALLRMTGQRAVPGTDQRLVVAQASGGRVAPAGPSATTQRAVPEVAQVSGGRVAPAGPSATTQRAVPEVAQVSGGRVAPAGPSATTQRALPEVAQASGGRVAPAGPSATTLWPSVLVAFLFAVHPLHVESVAWASERRDVLSAVLLMLLLLAYTAYARRRSKGRYLVVCLVFALGLMAKASLVPVPIVLMLLDYWPLGRFGAAEPAQPVTSYAAADRSRRFPWRLVAEKIPLLALAIGASAIEMSMHAEVHDPLTLGQKVGNALVACVSYLGQFVYPVGLVAFYQHPGATLPLWKPLCALVLLSAITAAAILARRRYPYVFVGWFWYLAMVGPMLGLVTLGAHAKADRYTYLSQIGLTIALAWGLADWARSWDAGQRRTVGWALAGGASLWIVVLAAAAWRQTGYWQSDETLWRHALATAPSAMAHMSYGAVLENEGKIDEANEQFRASLAIDPAVGPVNDPVRARMLSRLGDIAVRAGRYDEAIDDYRQGVAIAPEAAFLYNNLAVALAKQGRLDEAVQNYQAALELAPDLADAHSNLANIFARRRQFDEAIRHYQQALAITPDFAAAHNNLAYVLSAQGRIDEAIQHYEQALAIDPNYVDARRNLARLQSARGGSNGQQVSPANP